MRISLGLTLVLLVAGLAVGYVLYRDQARADSVKEFKKKSEPEFARIEEAMGRLVRSVTPQLLGDLDVRRIRRAEFGAERARVIKEEAGFSITSLDYPMSQVNALRDVLKTADVRALTEVDHPFAAGTSEQMRAAARIGDRNRALITEIRAFLPRYEALISSIRTHMRLNSAFAVALVAGVGEFAHINSLAQGKRVLRSMRRKLVRVRTRLRRNRPATELRQVHRLLDRQEAGIVDDLDRIASALDRQDIAGLEAAGASLDHKLARPRRDKRLTFKAIVVNSALSRQMRRLVKRQTGLQQAYGQLED